MDTHTKKDKAKTITLSADAGCNKWKGALMHDTVEGKNNAEFA